MKKFFALTSGDVTDLEIANQQAVREKAGEIIRGDLQFCAANTLRVALKTL